MKKDIKNYLHLYLKCGGSLVRKTEEYYHKFYSDGEWLLSGTLYQEIMMYGHEFKPHLRPLTNMTEEEAIEMVKLTEWEPHFNDVKIYCNKFKDIIVSWQGMLESREEFNATGELFYCSEQFQWLLSKHFDLFELIEAGLAIDKSKQTA